MLREQSGQVFAITAVGMVAICGVAGFAIDTGTRYRAHRAQQAIADAAALAAASDLPTGTGQATADAAAYAAKNGAGSTALSVTFSSTYVANDTVTVKTTQTAPANTSPGAYSATTTQLVG